MSDIKNFKDVYEGSKLFDVDSEQVKITDVINKQIVVKEFKELDSKFTDGTYAVILLECDGKTMTLATGSKVLIDQLNHVKEIPFNTTIKKIKNYYTFS